MRFHEICGGFNIPVSLEEQGLIDLIESQEDKFITLTELDERQRELARKMVSRGVLDRTQRDNNLFYMVNRPEDLWRT